MFRRRRVGRIVHPSRAHQCFAGGAWGGSLIRRARINVSPAARGGIVDPPRAHQCFARGA